MFPLILGHIKILRETKLNVFRDERGNEIQWHCFKSDFSLECLKVMDLFRLYILFSQYRSCDRTQEICLVHEEKYMQTYSCLHVLVLMNKTNVTNKRFTVYVSIMQITVFANSVDVRRSHLTWRYHSFVFTGACEGTLSCSTCHLIFKPDEMDKLKLDEPSDEELDMLDLAYGLEDT